MVSANDQINNKTTLDPEDTNSLIVPNQKDQFNFTFFNESKTDKHNQG